MIWSHIPFQRSYQYSFTDFGISLNLDTNLSRKCLTRTTCEVGTGISNILVESQFSSKNLPLGTGVDSATQQL